MGDPAARSPEPYGRALSAMTFVAIVGLIGWSFWKRYALLASSPHPLGVDGYFYPIQLRSLLDHGALYYPSAPLTFWFMAPFAALTDPVVGAKLGAALGSALMVWPVYVLGRRIGGARGPGLLAAVLVASSAQSTFLCAEFVKQGFGLTVATGYLCALGWALEPAGAGASPWLMRPRRFLGALGLLVATALAHPLALAVAVVASVPPVVVAWREAGASVHTRARHGLALVAALGLAGSAWLLCSDSARPAVLSRLVMHALDGPWDTSLPALHVPGNPALRFQHETSIAAASAAALLLAWLLRRIAAARFAMRPLGSETPAERRDRALVLGPAFLALLAALPFLDVADPQGLAFRMRLTSFVALALLAAALASLLRVRLSRARAGLATASFALAFMLARPAYPREGVVEVHPAMQAGMRALAGLVPAGDVIIVPERHLMFMAAWYSGYATRLRPEPIEPARRWRLVPMAYMSEALERRIDQARGSAPAELPRPRGLHPGHENGLVLMPEATWQWIVGSLPEPESGFYQRWPTL